MQTGPVAARTPNAKGGLRIVVFCGGDVRSQPLPHEGEVVIGRGDDALVRIDHVTVSRRHATLVVGDGLRIIDHGSFNGTTIGGKKIAPNVPVALGLSTIAELGDAMIVVQPEGVPVVTGSQGLTTSAGPRQDVSAAMQHVYRNVDAVAQSSITVVVRGETGVGKEVLAEEIHRRSARAAGPLVKLNCAALPEHLLEGELFGYERGAFTGATQAKAGLVESADGGTLFLDEVGELPPATQAKLLRVVESREVLRLGSLKPKAVDVRFLAATHRDLEDMVARGVFREDLYYRLNGVSIWVPPLRERVEEIPRLAHELLARFCRESKRPTLPITDQALGVLKTYPWPGNVRELRNVIERAVVFCRSIAIAPEHLGLGEMRASRPPMSAAVPASMPVSAPVSIPTGPPPPPGSTMAYGSTLPDEMERLERQRILDALAQCGGNQTAAAEMLGISRRTLLRRLDDYNVPRPRKP